MYAMYDPQTDPQNHSLSANIPSHGNMSRTNRDWGDSRMPVYVHSIVAANICFSFRGRSKNWWRRPLKILVPPGKRLPSLNPKTSYRLRYCSSNSPTWVYKWLLTFPPEESGFMPLPLGEMMTNFRKPSKINKDKENTVCPLLWPRSQTKGLEMHGAERHWKSDILYLVYTHSLYFYKVILL